MTTATAGAPLSLVGARRYLDVLLAILRERQAELRRAWRARAIVFYFGTCDTCHRSRDDDGGPLLVARQPHQRLRGRECLRCYTGRVTRR